MDYRQGCHALPPERRDLALYHERAARIREHAGFRAKLAAAVANRFADRAPSPYPEATLYSGGFLSNEDRRLSERWHGSPWEDRPMIAAQFGDERLKAFANRLMLLEAPHAMCGWLDNDAAACRQPSTRHRGGRASGTRLPLEEVVEHVMRGRNHGHELPALRSKFAEFAGIKRFGFDQIVPLHCLLSL
jgi:hypothetical protein